MSDPLTLTGFRGTNPLGFLAALGVLDVLTRQWPDRRVRLHWTDALEPTAVLTGAGSMEEVVDACDRDRQEWATSPILTWGPGARPLDDLKPSLPDLRRWIEFVVDDFRRTGDGRHVTLLAGLVAEGAAAGKGDAKPTHLHFTAGQQKFLVMVRELQQRVTVDDLKEALFGPWRYASTRPVLGWDGRGERIWALRADNPSGDKKLGVPGADWLAFLGLRFLPVALSVDRYGRPSLMTTGCSPSWKSGTFTWPLWAGPLGADAAAAVIGDQGLVRLSDEARQHLGVLAVVRAPIRRSDQGGYGSFGPAQSVMSAPDPSRQTAGQHG